MTSERVMFSPGEIVKIRVAGETPSDEYAYTGILMSVRKDGESFGVWKDLPEGYKLVDCSSKIGSAISDADENEKRVGEHVFQWTAPDKCVTNEIYYVNATMVKSKREFLDVITLPLKCVLPPEDERNDSCSREYRVIPDGFDTSFESRGLGNWKNDENGKLVWRSWRGATPSPGTGPRSAYDGERYLYVETSFPARENQSAVLVSPPGLAGCFCFRFAYHMYTDVGANFYCKVNGKTIQCQHPDYFSKGILGAPMDVSRDRWIESWISINEPSHVEIQIIAVRGTTFRGDIALDDFSFTPGRCVASTK